MHTCMHTCGIYTYVTSRGNSHDDDAQQAVTLSHPHLHPPTHPARTRNERGTGSGQGSRRRIPEDAARTNLRLQLFGRCSSELKSVLHDTRIERVSATYVVGAELIDVLLQPTTYRNCARATYPGLLKPAATYSNQFLLNASVHTPC